MNVCQCPKGSWQLGADQCVEEYKGCPSEGDKCKLEDGQHPKECPIAGCMQQKYPDNCKHSSVATWGSSQVGLTCCPEQCKFRVDGTGEVCKPLAAETTAPTATKDATKDCTKGYELDEKANTCVPVTCDAELACKDGQKCSPMDLQCITSPCPQFKCEDGNTGRCMCPLNVAPVCFDGVTYNNKCVANCNQTAVELMQTVKPGLVDGKCGQTKECTEGYELDEEANTCVPVTRDAELACKNTETCSKSKQVCTSKPCKNFICEPTQCVCTKELVPVCFDSVTYPNKCMASCNQTAVRRLRLVRPGLVAGECKQEKPGEKSCRCTKVRHALR
jgi:hypothetical protein